MSIRFDSFLDELTKIGRASSEKDRKKGYGAAVVATAPAAIAQAASDYPKGWVDKKVETAVGQGWKKARKVNAWKTGAGRAAGRLGAGVATAPVFFSGIKDVREGEKKRGYAKIVGSSGAFSLGKGGIEAAVEGGKNLNRAQLMNRIRRVAGTRGLLGTASGVATAIGVARSQKGDKKDQGSFKNRVLKPAAIGTGIGAMKGAIEDVAVRGSKATRRSVAAGASGRAAAGALGALAISEISRKLAKKDKEKKASLAVPGSQPLPAMAPSPGQLYDQTRDAMKERPTEDLQAFLKVNEDPERTPSRRAVTYAVNDELRSRGVSVPKEKVRDRTRKKDIPPTTLLHTATAAAIVSAPSLAWEMGFLKVPKKQQNVMLQDAMDRLIAAQGIELITAGTSGESLDLNAKPSDFYASLPGGKDPFQVVKGSGQEADRVRKLYRKGQRRFISTTDRDPFVLAHELGHATAGELRRKTIASSTSQLLYRASTIPAVALPLLALDSAADGSFHTEEELLAKARFSEGVSLLAAALGSGHLAEEATASVKGLNMLRQAGASSDELARGALTKMAPAFATYLAPAATGIVAGQILRRHIRKNRKEKNKK